MASDSLSEQEVQFRKRARRRLIGAIALVLLMVTILPMVLDDQEPSAPQQEIAISIPSQDGADFTSKIVPAPSTEAVPPAETPPLPMASPIEPPPAPAPAAVVAAPAVKTAPVADAPKPAVAVEAKLEPEKQAPAPAEAAKTKAPEPAGASKTGFSVQIGVFSDPVKVKQLQSRLKAQGVTSYTEKLGTKIRLRSGPYATRAAAEKVQEKLKQMNMTSMVVTNK